MSESVGQKSNGLSAIERLKTTDKYLTEMSEMLQAMDEIAALRKSRGEAVSDEYSGYKRSSVESFIRELKKQKAAILDEIEKDVQQRRSVPASPLSNKNTTVRPQDNDNTVTSFQKGDPSLALESMYTGLSMDIERAYNDILQEMKYTYKQDMAIYDDLASKIDAIKSVDTAAFEEQMKPLGENMSTVNESLTSLSEKVNSLENIDYNAVAQHVAEKMIGGIDYNALAQHIVGIMTGGLSGVTMASPQERTSVEIEKKLDRIENILDGAVNVKQMPEFQHLDRLIEDYLFQFSYDLIPDILMTANEIRNLANQYIERGNVLRGELMFTDLRTRLIRINVWGSSAIAVVADAIETHQLPLTYSTEAFANFLEATREYEQAPANADDALIHKLLSCKKAMFADPEAEASDRETFAEMLEIQQDAVGELDKEQIDSLMQLKKELMSFNLSYFVNLIPSVYKEDRVAEPVTSSVDTKAILDAIEKGFASIPVGAGSEVAAAESAVSSPQTDSKRIQSRIRQLSESEHNVTVKKNRMRAAVSSKDNQLEKPEQPLRVVHNKINVVENEDALSRQIVDQLAQRIANSMVK